MFQNPTTTRTVRVRARRLPEFIPEDSLTNKVIACIPIIGTDRTHRISASIDGKFQNARDLDTMIRLISLKNQFKALTIIRAALIAAFLFYLGGEDSNPLFRIALYFGLLPSIWIHGRDIAYNRQTIKALKTNGLDSIRPIL